MAYESTLTGDVSRGELNEVGDGALACGCSGASSATGGGGGGGGGGGACALLAAAAAGVMDSRRLDGFGAGAAVTGADA
jgi:hypothetical protein